MQYITHTKFKGTSLDGKGVLISRGKRLERKDDILYFENHPICIYRSECAKMHFSKDDDKHGLERGDLTRKIAYSDNRVNVNGWISRFSEEQAEILCSDKWNKFLRKGHDVILFDDNFFDADLEELKELLSELG